MKLLPIFLSALILSALPLTAQTTLAEMQAARNYRQDMAVAVAQNTETAKDAIKRLRKEVRENGKAHASGEAQLAPLAEDIAQRLLAMERPDAAEAFFKLAEEDYEQATKRMTRGQRGKKVGYLKNLAGLRIKRLGKIKEAEANLDEAIRLAPEDEALKKHRRKLAKRGQHPRSRQKKQGD